MKIILLIMGLILFIPHAYATPIDKGKALASLKDIGYEIFGVRIDNKNQNYLNEIIDTIGTEERFHRIIKKVVCEKELFNKYEVYVWNMETTEYPIAIEFSSMAESEKKIILYDKDYNFIKKINKVEYEFILFKKYYNDILCYQGKSFKTDTVSTELFDIMTNPLLSALN